MRNILVEAGVVVAFTLETTVGGHVGRSGRRAVRQRGLLLIVSDPIKYLVPAVPQYTLVPTVLLAPIFEEMLFRGGFLRSLEARMSVLAAVPTVALMAAAMHKYFWMALVSQLVLSLVYVCRDHSLAAAVMCHASMNGVFFLPLLGFVQKWNIPMHWK